MENTMETSPNNGSSSGTSSHFQEIGHSAQKLMDESRGLVTDIAATLDIRGRMDRRPYQTLLIAAGIGYVLGGGLFSGLTGTLLRTTLRAKFSDAQCGFKAVRADALETLLPEVRDEEWFFDTELLTLPPRFCTASVAESRL